MAIRNFLVFRQSQEFSIGEKNTLAQSTGWRVLLILSDVNGALDQMN
jgi:hypothetical protein